MPIPNLWHSHRDAVGLYSLYLSHLQKHRRDDRVVAVGPQIRRYAARRPSLAEQVFTFPFEIDSLCSLGDYRTAWRQLRRRDEIIFGKRFSLQGRVWSPADGRELAVSYAPLLYFLGRYQQGCTLLETALDFQFADGNPRSFNILSHVFNGEDEPGQRCHVALAHFYRRLGRDLRQWRHWPAFVQGLHPRLFRHAAIRREELLAGAGRLAEFVAALMAVRNERTPTGIGGSLSDLLGSAAKVRARQAALGRRLDAFHERTALEYERTQQRLQELFPELRELLE